ncbi:MAG TPA: acyl-CoA dehydrogenase family protein, partial [Burkholderiales bacterium]
MRRHIFEPEHEQFRESARRFFQSEIGPNGARWRAQGYVDREAFRRAGELGYLLMWADERYGGSGVADFRYEQI